MSSLQDDFASVFAKGVHVTPFQAATPPPLSLALNLIL